MSVRTSDGGRLKTDSTRVGLTPYRSAARIPARCPNADFVSRIMDNFSAVAWSVRRDMCSDYRSPKSQSAMEENRHLALMLGDSNPSDKPRQVKSELLHIRHS